MDKGRRTHLTYCSSLMLRLLHYFERGKALGVL